MNRRLLDRAFHAQSARVSTPVIAMLERAGWRRVGDLDGELTLEKPTGHPAPMTRPRAVDVLFCLTAIVVAAHARWAGSPSSSNTRNNHRRLERDVGVQPPARDTQAGG
jgi:hypothetical protein